MGRGEVVPRGLNGHEEWDAPVTSIPPDLAAYLEVSQQQQQHRQLGDLLGG